MEKQMPLVSVIMCCRNSVECLEASVRSLTQQGLSNDQLEVIALYDSSQKETDTSLRRLADELPFLRLEATEAQSVSEQRNRGLDKACGEYVAYLDAGDLLCPGALKELTDRMAADMLDLLWFEAEPVNTGKGQPAACHWNEDYPEVTSGRALFTAMRLNNDWHPQAWMQLVRRALLTGESIVFPAGDLADELYALHVAHAAQRARCVHDRLYRRLGSVRAAGTLHDYACILPGIMAYLPEDGQEIEPDYRRALMRQAESLCLLVCGQADALSHEERETLPDDAAWVVRYAEMWKQQRRHAGTQYARIQELNAENKTLRTEKGERWQIMQALRGEIAGLKEEKKALWTEKGQRWQEMQALRGEIAKLKEEAKALRTEKGQRWQEMQALRGEIARLKEEAKALRTEKVERWNENLAAKKKLNEQIKALREQMQTMQEEHKNELDVVSAQRQALMDERHYLRGQLEEQFKLMDQARRSALVRIGMRMQGMKEEKETNQEDQSKE